MANPGRNRKRVNAIRRAPDGSAFETCEYCGVSVAVALADMHHCEPKKDVKRFKGVPQKWTDSANALLQPRSPFRLFMERFSKDRHTNDLIEIDREGFETWKNMSEEERRPFVVQAEQVNAECERALLKEIKCMPLVDDEAVSARVGKSDQSQLYEDYEDWNDFENSSWCRESESLNIAIWAPVMCS